jgi:hypothetical protein
MGIGERRGDGVGMYVSFVQEGIIMDAKEQQKNAGLTHAQVLYVE